MERDESGISQVNDFQRELAALKAPQKASIYADSIGVNAEVRQVVIDLSTARLRTNPYRIGFPFRSFVVLDATDSNVSANLVLSTDDSYQDAITIRKNAGLVLPFAVSKASLYWSAQSSKTITILFFLTGEFRTNAVNLTQSGGVTISEGSSVAVPVLATVSTAAQLFAQNFTNVKTMINNYGGVSIFIGGSATLTDDDGATPGIEIAPGGSYAWESTAACFAVSKGGVSNAAIAYTIFS